MERKGIDKHNDWEADSKRALDTCGEALWARSVFIECQDGRWRRVPPESILQRVADGVSESVVAGGPEGGFPLAEKVEGSAVLLKGYGNAIVPQVAAEFIRAFMECERGQMT